MRYELKLDFKRMEMVKADKGYRGPGVVCAIYFTPVAGYIPDRPVIKYLAPSAISRSRFVPLAGTRILVPFRMMVPTPLGTAMLEATQFVTQPRRRTSPRRSSSTKRCVIRGAMSRAARHSGRCGSTDSPEPSAILRIWSCGPLPE